METYIAKLKNKIRESRFTRGFLSIFNWALTPAQLEEQVENYHTLKFLKSARGAAVLATMATVPISLIFSSINRDPQWTVNLVSVLAACSLASAVIYLGVRELLILLMIIAFNQNRHFLFESTYVIGTISCVSWFIWMKFFYPTLQVAQERRKRKNAPMTRSEEEERGHHYIAEDSWFEIDVPAVVRKEEEKKEDPERGWSKTISYTTELSDFFYSIVHYSFERGHVDEHNPLYNVKKVLEGSLETLVRDCVGYRLVSSDFTSFLGHQALDAELRSDTTIYKITLFFNGRDSYLIYIIYPLHASPKPTFDGFKSSFKFREKISPTYHFVSEEADFEVDFPGEPIRTEARIERIEESNSPGSRIAYTATTSGGVVFYSINCHRYDAQKEFAYNFAYNTQSRLEEMVVGTMNKGENELLSKEFVSFLDMPAVKFVIRNSLQIGEEKIFLLLNFLIFFKDGNVYELASMHPEGMALEPNFEEFTASFRLL